MNWNAKMLVALLAATTISQLAAAQEQKLAFIDLDKAFTEYHKTKIADGQLKEQAEEFKADRKKLIKQHEDLQQTFEQLRDESKNVALSEDARALKRSQAEDKMVEVREMESKIRRFDESKQKQLDEQSKRIRKNLVEEINLVVSAYARGEGFCAVIDSSGDSFNGVPMVLFVDSKFDITAAVLAQLNAGKTVDASHAAPKSKKK